MQSLYHIYIYPILTYGKQFAFFIIPLAGSSYSLLHSTSASGYNCYVNTLTASAILRALSLHACSFLLRSLYWSKNVHFSHKIQRAHFQFFLHTLHLALLLFVEFIFSKFYHQTPFLVKESAVPQCRVHNFWWLLW